MTGINKLAGRSAVRGWPAGTSSNPSSWAGMFPGRTGHTSKVFVHHQLKSANTSSSSSIMWCQQPDRSLTPPTPPKDSGPGSCPGKTVFLHLFQAKFATYILWKNSWHHIKPSLDRCNTFLNSKPYRSRISSWPGHTETFFTETKDQAFLCQTGLVGNVFPQALGFWPPSRHWQSAWRRCSRWRGSPGGFPCRVFYDFAAILKHSSSKSGRTCHQVKTDKISRSQPWKV